MKSKIWLSSPHMGGNEMKYVQEAYDTNWVAPLGPNVNEFENVLASYTNAGHASALSAGTAAIHLALILLGVKAGDEVIAQSFTFSATVNPISYLGATPVLVDSEEDTWNMCPRSLKAAIVDRIAKGTKPKAIIPVHLYGMPANMKDINAVANFYGIPVVEDAAEALGSSLAGKKMGSWGKFGVLSFNGNKIITTSGGGALLSEDKQLIEKSRFLATQARDAAPHYQHTHVGYNYRMSNILAGIGRGQMEVLEDRVNYRRKLNVWYRRWLKDVPGISFQSEPSQDYYSNYWLTAILVDPKKTGGITREDIRLFLEKENIESRPLWKPMHMQPVFEDCPYYGNGTSDRLFEQGLCLPSGSNMGGAELYRVVDALRKVVSMWNAFIPALESEEKAMESLELVEKE
ncbi:DegT/DnrJ/EryC1/StrS family aminotransferase [Ancylomarina sp. YFZ004]